MWQTQSSNQGNRLKLLVFFYDSEPERVKTYHAFNSEEKKSPDKAISKMTQRLINGKLRGHYKTAIFYLDGKEIEKWIDGVKQQT